MATSKAMRERQREERRLRRQASNLAEVVKAEAVRHKHITGRIDPTAWGVYNSLRTQESTSRYK
ncbi:MAG: hypothetical protein ACRKFN_11190 [Desulfitobacterium sp.]